MTPAQKYLKSIHACPEACAWVGERTLREAWDACDRVDWMHYGLEAVPRAARDKATAEARAAYDKATAMAKASAEPWAAYDKARASATATYVEAMTAILACKTCDEVRARFACPEVT